ncbi:uncharacterized protein LOC123315480 [Coccinella septempunctata]|uniref:uncharacterized protein LOC123315480 n=1 Tax=Coccinella septempunctata TaxID=41139 RepID=UPI001D065582|nr:uncharacterized protein LOC123315480 [Coccinella septempunctata]
MYNKIVIKDVVHLHELHRKTLKPEALPTIQHQFHSYAGEHLAKEQMLQDKQKLVHQQPEIIQHQEEIVNQHSQQQSEAPIEHNYCVQQSEKPLQYLLDKYQQFLPQHWAYIPKPDGIEYIRLDPETRLIKNHIMVRDDLTVLVIFPNKERLHVDDQIVSSLPEDVYAFLKSVEKWPLCVGTQIENQSFSKGCQGVIVGHGMYKRMQQNLRCQSCRVLRKKLNDRKGGNSVQEKWIIFKRKKGSTLKQCNRLQKKCGCSQLGEDETTVFCS